MQFFIQQYGGTADDQMKRRCKENQPCGIFPLHPRCEEVGRHGGIDQEGVAQIGAYLPKQAQAEHLTVGIKGHRDEEVDDRPDNGDVTVNGLPVRIDNAPKPNVERQEDAALEADNIQENKVGVFPPPAKRSSVHMPSSIRNRPPDGTSAFFCGKGNAGAVRRKQETGINPCVTALFPHKTPDGSRMISLKKP